ncbi:hypothetical protein NEOC95_001436 [Neochlamydia sp. AcF95]|nr:hypothetical protein [Neochlamydia sp. AcF95]
MINVTNKNKIKFIYSVFRFFEKFLIGLHGIKGGLATVAYFFLKK